MSFPGGNVHQPVVDSRVAEVDFRRLDLPLAEVLEPVGAMLAL